MNKHELVETIRMMEARAAMLLNDLSKLLEELESQNVTPKKSAMSPALRAKVEAGNAKVWAKRMSGK